jgi:hypothetical protein
VFWIAVGFAGNRKKINDFVTAVGQGNQPRINMALQPGQVI